MKSIFRPIIKEWTNCFNIKTIQYSEYLFDYTPKQSGILNTELVQKQTNIGIELVWTGLKFGVYVLHLSWEVNFNIHCWCSISSGSKSPCFKGYSPVSNLLEAHNVKWKDIFSALQEFSCPQSVNLHWKSHHNTWEAQSSERLHHRAHWESSCSQMQCFIIQDPFLRHVPDYVINKIRKTPRVQFSKSQIPHENVQYSTGFDIYRIFP